MTSITMEVGNYDYGGYKVVIVAAILIFMQISMVSGRLFSRRLQKVWLGIDDYVLISATVRMDKRHIIDRLLMIDRSPPLPCVALPLHFPESLVSAVGPFSNHPTASQPVRPRSHGSFYTAYRSLSQSSQSFCSTSVSSRLREAVLPSPWSPLGLLLLALALPIHSSLSFNARLYRMHGTRRLQAASVSTRSNLPVSWQFPM